MTQASQSLPKNPNRQNNSELLQRVLWQRKFGPAFWTITGVFSLAVNIILIFILIILGRQLFALKGIVEGQLIGGLATNFQAMDDATIVTTVKVNDTIPVVFDLPVSTNTTVSLTEPTPIYGAQVSITTPYLSINAPADIVLPEGLPLPIALGISVPVSTTVPVVLKVPVKIPLAKTELHEPFVGLQEVVSPYNSLLGDLPGSWNETPVCQPPLTQICNWLFDLPKNE